MLTRRKIILTLCKISLISVLFVLPRSAHAGLWSWYKETWWSVFSSPFKTVANWFTPDVVKWITTALVFLGNFFVWLFGIVLSIVAKLFDLSIYFSVVKFNEFATTDAIKVAWTTSRDFANVFFIFILLYIAIGTILQISGIDAKRMVVKVIIIALLINFSRVLTGVVIDSGNVVAFQFYKAIGTTNTGDQRGISDTFVSALQVQSPLAVSQEIGSSPEEVSKSKGLNPFDVLLHTIGAIILILVTSFVLFAGAMLLILRIVSLIFLIVLSPLAFLAYAFPKQEQYFNTWLDSLVKQTFFAPAYLFMLYLVAKIINTSDLTNSTGGTAGATASVKGIGIVINFIILIGLLLGSIIIATKMGATGAQTVAGWQKKLTGRAKGYATGAGMWAGRKTVGFATRNTVGRVGRSIAESSMIKNLEKSNKVPNFARGVRNLGKRAQDVDFGLKGASLNDFGQEKLKRANLDDYKGDPEAQAQILRNLTPEARLAYYRKLEAKDRAKLEAETINDPKLAKIFEKLRTQLPNEKDRKDTGKALEIAKAEKDVSDGLKMMKGEEGKEGEVPSIGDDGKVVRDQATGKIVVAAEADREAQLKKFVKLIKPGKDTSEAIAGILDFNSDNPKKKELSTKLIQSLSNLQINRLLKDDSIDAMKNSEKTLAGISESINSLDDSHELKKYVRSTSAFSSLLGIKKSKVDPEIQENIDVLKKTDAEMQALPEIKNDPALVQLQDDRRMHRGGDTETEQKIKARQDELIQNKKKDALREIVSAGDKGMAALTPTLSVSGASPEEIGQNAQRTEFILKNLSGPKVKKLEENFTQEQREQFNEYYKEKDVGVKDAPLARQLNALDINYLGRPVPVETAGGTATGNSGPGVSVVVGVGGSPTLVNTPPSGPQIIPAMNEDLGGVPGRFNEEKVYFKKTYSDSSGEAPKTDREPINNGQTGESSPPPPSVPPPTNGPSTPPPTPPPPAPPSPAVTNFTPPKVERGPEVVSAPPQKNPPLNPEQVEALLKLSKEEMDKHLSQSKGSEPAPERITSAPSVFSRPSVSASQGEEATYAGGSPSFNPQAASTARMESIIQGTANIPAAKPEVVAQEGDKKILQELFDVGLKEKEGGQTVDQREKLEVPQKPKEEPKEEETP